MKLYKIAYNFTMKVIIKSKLRKIFQAKILLVFYIHLKLLNNCFSKLGIFYKKYFIIYIINHC